MKFYIIILSLIISACSSPDNSKNENNNLNNIDNSNNFNNTNSTQTNNINDAGTDTDSTVDPTPVQCEPDLTFTQAPAFVMPDMEDWNHSLVTPATVNSGSPYHMIHDEMVLENTPVQMKGKFDYNRILHKDLQDEYILVYIWGSQMSSWEFLGRYLTDSDGVINFQISGKPEGSYILRGIVAGDLTEAFGYLTVVKPGRKAVVFDIDGTITTSDSEVIQDWAEFSAADMYPYANTVVNHYFNRGFLIVMVTGRPYWLATESRQWLSDNDMPFQSVRFTSDNGTTVSGEETQEYKTTYLQSLISDCYLEIVRAYGNAVTDIGAYEAVGIPKTETFIIGENAGTSETQPISCEDCGYQSHYNDFLVPEDIQCILDLNSNL